MQVDDDVTWTACNAEVAVEVGEVWGAIPHHLDEFGCIGQPAELAAPSAIDLTQAEPTGRNGRVPLESIVELGDLLHFQGVCSD